MITLFIKILNILITKLPKSNLQVNCIIFNYPLHLKIQVCIITRKM